LIFSYIFEIFYEAWINFKRGKLITFISIFTIAFSTMIIEEIFILTKNFNNFILSWEKKSKISIFLKENVNKNKVIENLKKLGLCNFSYISKDKILNKLEIPKSLSNLFPDVIEIDLKESKAEDLIGKLRRLKEVDLILRDKTSEKLNTYFSLAKLILYNFSIFVILPSIFILINTVKLTILTRRKEIEIMRLFGATKGFIECSFFISGIYQGIVGITLSSIFLYFLLSYFKETLNNFFLEFFGIKFIFPSISDIFLFIFFGSFFIGFINFLIAKFHKL